MTTAQLKATVTSIAKTKRCGECKARKPLDQFRFVGKRHPGSRRSQCAECHRREKANAYKRRRRVVLKSGIREIVREYRNSERVMAAAMRVVNHAGGLDAFFREFRAVLDDPRLPLPTAARMRFAVFAMLVNAASTSERSLAALNAIGSQVA
jgi:hypothetical protein